jgi:hypothetical protein
MDVRVIMEIVDGNHRVPRTLHEFDWTQTRKYMDLGVDEDEWPIKPNCLSLTR